MRLSVSGLSRPITSHHFSIREIHQTEHAYYRTPFLTHCRGCIMQFLPLQQRPREKPAATGWIKPRGLNVAEQHLEESLYVMRGKKTVLLRTLDSLRSMLRRGRATVCSVAAERVRYSIPTVSRKNRSTSQPSGYTPRTRWVEKKVD